LSPKPAEAIISRAESAIASSRDGLSALTGVVRMPDGSPALGATVRSFTGSDEPAVSARTDSAGRFQLHVVRLSSGSWHENRAFQVTSDKPLEFEFHRAWLGDRRITGRLMGDGKPYTPSPTPLSRAWVCVPRQSGEIPATLEPVVRPDGTFEVAFDAEAASLFFFDREQKRSGFAEGLPGDVAVDLKMELTATYSGTLMDENNQPMRGRALELYVKESDRKNVASRQTDQAGRFWFTGIPSRAPLQLTFRSEDEDPEYFLVDGEEKVIATQRIAMRRVTPAVNTAVEFVERHRLPVRNALTLLTHARNEAKRSRRRVWVIRGGPRCDPCVRLNRWIEDHHATLDQDYVFVKLIDVVDERVKEALAGLPIAEEDGFPWFAITELDGTVLAISRGALGNIGFPSCVEGIRHFPQMLDRTVQSMTSDNADQLMKSLSSGK
jgi:hypothetical protein